MNIRLRLVTGAIVAVAAFTAFSSPAAGQSAPKVIQPGAPGEPSRVVDPAEPNGAGQIGYTEADVRFVQMMIPHHAQALEMTALVPTRSTNKGMHLLAERIEVSQQDEIAWMRSWLERRQEPTQSAHAHQHHHGAHGQSLMPGMLTPDEMAQLEHATGVEFDHLFLQFMIRHHEGALAMVEELFATKGAAQEPEIYRFASDVEADQRAEIRRMQAMLGTLPAQTPHH